MLWPELHHGRAKGAAGAAGAVYGFAGSGDFHGLLAVAALLLVVGAGRRSIEPGSFESDWSAPADAELRRLASQATETEFARTELPMRVAVQHGSLSVADPASELLEEETETGEPSGDGLPRGAEWLQAVAARSASGMKAGSGDEDRGLRGAGGNSFFGVPADGQRIVYVVDCSGSMLTRHLEAQNRFERLKIELRRSIEGLAEDRKFFVIFFNETSIPMPAPKEMQPAVGSAKQRFLSWVDAQRADGGTEPADALRFALRLKPDTIFLLSDGSFSPKTAKLLRVLNRNKVTIHTIGFSDQANASLLGGIAADHAGTYRFVP
jgi:hypothetical protein